MSSSYNSSKDVSREPAGVVDELDKNKEVEKCKDLLIKMESGFSGITQEIVKHFGKEFSDGTLKSLLECAICKDIIIGTVSRKCSHNFCHLCLTDWFKRSANCPICRDNGCLTVKNPLFDQLIDLMVDLTFTEEEKSERSNLIQQRSVPSSGANEEDATRLRDIEYVAVLDPSLDTNLLARTVCVAKAHSLLDQISRSDQFNQLISDAYCAPAKQLAIEELVASFEDDVNSMKSLLKLSPITEALYV